MLQLGNDESIWNEYYQDLIFDLCQDGRGMHGVELVVANSLWVKGTTKPKFQSLCKDVFHAEVCDMGTAADINAWVAVKTKGNIKQILTAEVCSRAFPRSCAARLCWAFTRSCAARPSWDSSECEIRV